MVSKYTGATLFHGLWL